MEIEITGLEEVKESLEAIPETTFTHAKSAFTDAVLLAQKGVVSRLSGNPMESRTGLLRKSLSTSVTGSKLENLRASFYSAGSVLGTPVVYAAIHEYGGTITAKNAYKGVPGGPYLNIPMDDNKTAAGVQRLTARQVFDGGGFIAKFRRSANYGVFMNDDLMFVLTKSVTIPARLGMRSESDKVVPGLLEELRNLSV